MFCTLFYFVSAAYAGDNPEPLVTDRPDIAESSLAVGKGVYQLEQGVSLSGAAGQAASVGFPSLSRLGLGGNVELRLETPIVAISDGGVGFDGLALGGKWHLPLQGPSLGILAHAELVPGGQVAPILKLAGDFDLPAGLELGINAGGTTAGGLEAPTGLWAVAMGRSVTDALRLYVEGSGDARLDGAAATVAVDGGFSYLISNDVQWDMSALYGVVGGGWGAGTGISVRFD